MGVNIKKTEFLISIIRLGLLEDSGKYFSAVCRKDAGSKLWVHKKCCGIPGWLVGPRICLPQITGLSRPIVGRPESDSSIRPYAC